MPADVPKMFANAWRLELAEDYAGSRAAWVRLRMLLDTANDRYGFASASADHPNALQRMLTPPSGPQIEPTEREMAAALNQFVTRRLTWATLQAKSSRS